MDQPTNRSLRPRRPNILVPNNCLTNLLHQIFPRANPLEEIHRNHRTAEFEAHLRSSDVRVCGADVVEHTGCEVRFEEVRESEEVREVLGGDYVAEEVDA
jgi:hypothetical protein